MARQVAVQAKSNTWLETLTVSSENKGKTQNELTPLKVLIFTTHVPQMQHVTEKIIP
jgi:hypothetical protein